MKYYNNVNTNSNSTNEVQDKDLAPSVLKDALVKTEHESSDDEHALFMHDAIVRMGQEALEAILLPPKKTYLEQLTYTLNAADFLPLPQSLMYAREAEQANARQQRFNYQDNDSGLGSSANYLGNRRSERLKNR